MKRLVTQLAQRVRCVGQQISIFITGVLLGAIVFGSIGWFLPSPFSPSRPTGGVLYQSQGSYQFIDPLLACDIGQDNSFSDLTSIHNTLEAVATGRVTSGDATNVSVYFRTLHNAHWFDINPQATYAPASLLKTFIMMAYFEEARENRDPALLTKSLVYEGSTTPAQDESGVVLPHLTNGKSYPTQDIIKQMIVYSDNDALNTLIRNGDDKMVQISNQIFSDLHIASPLTAGDTLADFMTVDQYSMVFRVLYGATYMGRLYSEQALGMLSQAAYAKGIVAGVPSGTVVAHKYGYSVGQSTAHTTPLELHDCGIVYYPGNPYLLCVMTKGTSLDRLQSTIKDISAAAWNGVGKLK